MRVLTWMKRDFTALALKYLFRVDLFLLSRSLSFLVWSFRFTLCNFEGECYFYSTTHRSIYEY